MSLAIFCAVLFAALLHAGWNAIVKRGGDTLLTTPNADLGEDAALFAAIGERPHACPLRDRETASPACRRAVG